MLLEAVRNLFSRHAPGPPVVLLPAETAPSLVPDADLAEDDDPVWSSARISLAEALWGEGFIFPGGEAETMHLTNPMGLTAAASLLVVGAGSGGPARCIANTLGVWVSAFEANARLATLASERSLRAGLARRAMVETWDPMAPRFPLHNYHHGMALRPLHDVAKPEPTLAAISLALKPGGQLVLVEDVADVELDPTDPLVDTWARLDHRLPSLPTELAITKVLGRLGFDVRIVEDVSRRHMRQAIIGWRAAVKAMEATKPETSHVALLVREAELWLTRLRLMRTGKLRLVRWHAIGRGGIDLPPG